MDRTKLSAARLTAIRKAPYFATAIFAMTPVEAPGLGTFAVTPKWGLLIDPTALERWSVEEVAAVLVHEVSHLLRDHAGRAERVGVGHGERRSWNCCADAEINDDLLSNGSEWALPGSPVTPASLGQPDGRLAEEYYRALPPRPSSGDEDSSADKPPTDKGGAGDGGEGDPGDEPSGSPNCGSGACGGEGSAAEQAAGSVEPRSANAIRRQVAQAIREAAKSQGNVPGGWQRWAEELLGEPKVDWRTALGALVRGGVADAMGAVDYRFNRPNRRTDQRVAPRVILPSLRQPVPRIGVVIDTSGSMSEADLTVAMRELAGILGTLGCTYGTRVYSVDAAVHVAQSVFDIGQVALVGGGGTDMGIGIAAAGDDGCDVVVVLTDCCTPWPIEAPSCYVVVAAIAKEEPGGVPSWATMIHVPPDALHESLTVAA